MYCLFRTLLLALLFGVAGGVFAASDDRLELGVGMEWYADEGQEFEDLASLREHESELDWTVSSDPAVSRGFNDTPHWFRMQVPALAEDSERKRYLHIPEALLNNIRLYVFHGDEVVQSETLGIDQPFTERPLRHREFVVPVMLDGDGSTHVYIRVQTSGSLQVQPLLWMSDPFAEQVRLESVASGLFYGAMLVMIFYNLFIYFVVRDRSYLYYIGVASMFTLFIGSLHGDTYQFLWPQWVQWNETSVIFAVGGLAVTSLAFTNSFLKLKRYWYRAYCLFTALLGVSIVLTVLSLFGPYDIMIRTNSLNGLIVMFIIVPTGIIMWLRGHRHARYFILAWLAFMLGTIALALSKFGVLPWNPITANGAQIGAVMEVVLLSFALGDRINQERAARFEAQKEALAAAEEAKSAQHELLEAKETANQELESRVRERTQELEQTLEKLETVNTFLEEVSNTDQLTGISNRHCFVNRYHEEYKRAQRHQYPISIVLMDIDYFKSFNDTYGHIAGDECLKAVSGALSRIISRAGDLLARFGGEEFIVMLSNTGIEGAEVVGERLRQAVAELVMHLEGDEVPITISVGVASEVPQNSIHAEQLIQSADNALYAAKEAGRNRVCRYPDDVATP